MTYTNITAARIARDYTLTGPDVTHLVKSLKLCAALTSPDLTDVLIALEQRAERLEDEINDVRCCSPNSVDAMNALDIKLNRLRALGKIIEAHKCDPTRLRKLAKMFEHAFETVIRDVA